jgi:hypothetical protein
LKFGKISPKKNADGKLKKIKVKLEQVYDLLHPTNAIPGQPALDACTRAFLVSLLPWISPELFDSPPAHAPSIMCQ